MSAQVIVVGAGPAGATCALHLAQAGMDVILADKSAPPRYKTCGGGIVGRALPPTGTDPGPTVERRCHRLELRLAGTPFEPAAPCEFEYTVERLEPPVVMVMRSRFDARLVESAVDAGAELRTPLEVNDVESTGSGVLLTTSEGKLRATCVVGADGAASRVARSAGWGPSKCAVPAIESELTVDPAIFERFARAARFDLGIVPHGYGWVFPKRDHLSVGCLTTAPGERSLPDLFETYLEAVGLGESLGREDHGYVIPTRPRDRRLARDRVLLVGDAAGLADPVACEGITNAICSGALAARALVERREDPSGAARRYRQLLEREILPELRLARRLAPLLYTYPRLRRFVFRRVGEALCEALTDLFVGTRTYRELLTGMSTYKRLLGSLVRARS
ncbi:MAG: NAD(P)/FAD-dependent oxidoreductase [Thermoanaerobaculia bacterium]